MKKKSNKFSNMNGHQRLVIGLGTGRSGTVSLSKFLGVQEKTFFVHEGAYKQKFFSQYSAGNYLPWKIDKHLFEVWYSGLRKASKGALYYGDVCASLLPYVSLILEKDPEAVFVCIKRDKTEVVNSFMHVTRGINYWNENEVFRAFDFWGEMFPTINSLNKRDALEKYWDLYHETVKSLEEKYPHAIRTFSINDLNTFEGREEILNFIGYPKIGRRIDTNFHANKRLNMILITILRTFMLIYAYLAKIGPYSNSKQNHAKDFRGES